MGLKSRNLPVCDVCGKEWLPDEGPAREDPRGYAINQWLSGGVPVRCGKCKTPYWDREFTGVSSKSTLAAFIANRKTDLPVLFDADKVDPAAVKVVTDYLNQNETEPAQRRFRCRHGLLSCPQCHKEVAA